MMNDTPRHLLDDRRSNSVLKVFVLPFFVVVGASIVSALANSYITTRLVEDQMEIFKETITQLHAIDTEMLSNLKQLEHSSIRADERYISTSLILEKLQRSTEDRYTGRDATKELEPLKYRLTQLELKAREMDNKLLTVMNKMYSN